LILESEHTTDDSLKITIPDLPYDFKKVGSTETMFRALNVKEYSLVLLNAEFKADEIAKTIKQIKRKSPDTEVLVLAGSNGHTLAVEAAKAGAADCLFKPVANNVLLAKIKCMCELVKTKNELMLLRQQVAMNYAFDNLIGVSAEIQKIKRTIQSISNNDCVIILSGEDGTGKNLLAKIIHYHSSRRKNPLVTLDCSVVPAAQIESELLRAASGTVFIDKLQLFEASTLAKLQNHFRRKPADSSCGFRLIMSVNEPLYDLFAKGVLERKFIEGLNAIEISLPPLRERTKDIELLTAYFLRLIAYENGSDTLSITADAIELLNGHSWPGNVRELENCLRRAAALCNKKHIDASEVGLVTSDSRVGRHANSEKDRPAKFGSLVENQRHLISQALESNEWNFTQTARQLGIGRTTLWRKVRKFNLKRDSINRLEVMRVTTDGEQK